VIGLVYTFRELAAMKPSGERHFAERFCIIILISVMLVGMELRTFGLLGKYANSGIDLRIIIHNLSV
jgi:hypothetical protein